MEMTWLDFETTPAAEKCEQLGPNYNASKARKEAREFIRMITEKFPPPSNCCLTVAENPHEFGTYLSIRANYPMDSEEGENWAFDIDCNPIEEWDDKARETLGLPLKV